MNIANHHCQPQWPFGHMGDHRTEVLRAAVSGASCCAALLAKDDAIKGWRELADDPDEEGLPFTPNVREGLSLALRTCLDTAAIVLERAEQEGLKQAMTATSAVAGQAQQGVTS